MQYDVQPERRAGSQAPARAQAAARPDAARVRRAQAAAPAGRRDADRPSRAQGPRRAPLPPNVVRNRAIALVVLIVLAVAVAAGVSRCAGAASQAQAQPADERPAAQAGVVPAAAYAVCAARDAVALFPAKAQFAAIDRDALADLIGDERADALIAAAKVDERARWIALNPQAFEPEGIEVQVKMLKLAADEPAAVPFVRAYPQAYPQEGASGDTTGSPPTGSPSADVPSARVPHLYQWDTRWGNTVYSSAPFGLTACGPTSLAMVYQGLTGKSDISPFDMAVLAQDRGYMTEYNGTAVSFFTEVAPGLGLACEEMDPTAENLVSALSAGRVVVAHLAPGLFTTGGHYFVLAGLAEDGGVILNDPYLLARSGMTWDAGTIAEESIQLFAYSAL